MRRSKFERLRKMRKASFREKMFLPFVNSIAGYVEKLWPGYVVS